MCFDATGAAIGAISPRGTFRSLRDASTQPPPTQDNAPVDIPSVSIDTSTPSIDSTSLSVPVPDPAPSSSPVSRLVNAVTSDNDDDDDDDAVQTNIDADVDAIIDALCTNTNTEWNESADTNVEDIINTDGDYFITAHIPNPNTINK